MIVYEKLLNYPIPEVRQQITRQSAALYALSIGLGQRQTDRTELDYVDVSHPLKVMPSMAVVLGHPGFWLSNPDTGVDALRVVHGEQSITLHTPLSTDTEIVGRTRVTGLIDKGAGKGALLFTEKQVIDVTGDTLLSTTSMTVFLRGDGGFGGPTGPSPSVRTMPETAPDLVSELPTRPEQALYYRLNGDLNPLHADPQVASAAGFPVPILHGLCTFGVVCHALLRTLADNDVAKFSGMSLRFSAPVYPGETIVTEIWRDGSFRARAAERDVVVVNNGFANIDRGAA
jgi:acyl dehydratase